MLIMTIEKYIRRSLIVGGGATMVAGCILVWMGFIISASSLVQSLDYDGIGILSVVCGAILLVLSVVGLYGSYKQEILYIIIFSVSSTILGLIILLMGGFVLKIKTLSGEVLMSKSHCLKNFKEAESLTSQASKVICSKYCPCEISENLNYSQDYQGSALRLQECNPCENIQLYQIDDQADVVQWVQTSLGFNVTPTECGITGQDFVDSYYSDQQTSYIEFVQWMEQEFKCSGMCVEQDKFLFSDVTSGKPKGPCFQKLKVWATKSFLAFGILAIIFGTFEIAISVAGTYYVFLLRKKKKELPTQIEITMEKKCQYSSQNSFR